jgi:hypothetical protein
LTSPSAVATASPATAASQTFAPAAKSCAKLTTETASVDAIEMSISPATTTNVRPKASRPMKT